MTARLTLDPLEQEDFPPDPASSGLEDGNLPAAGPSPWARAKSTEPVRLYLWPVVVAAVGLLVGYGVLDEDLAAGWVALAAAVLGVAGWAGIEAARGAVFTPEGADRQARRAAAAAARAAVLGRPAP